MSDIFISYASADRPRAGILAQALAPYGWSVWWDRDIPVGKPFPPVIEEQLTVAKCVIVLWSEAAVKSDWVQNEAAEGKERGILVPALIADVKIPLEFRRIQTARLIEWRGEPTHPEFTKLLTAIEQHLGRRNLSAEERGAEEAGKPHASPLLNETIKHPTPQMA